MAQAPAKAEGYVPLGKERLFSATKVPKHVNYGKELEKKGVFSQLSRQNVLQLEAGEELIYHCKNTSQPHFMVSSQSCNCICVTNRRLVKIEGDQLVHSVNIADMGFVTHVNNGPLRYDHIRISTHDAKEINVGVFGNAISNFLVDELLRMARLMAAEAERYSVATRGGGADAAEAEDDFAVGQAQEAISALLLGTADEDTLEEDGQKREKREEEAPLPERKLLEPYGLVDTKQARRLQQQYDQVIKILERTRDAEDEEDGAAEADAAAVGKPAEESKRGGDDENGDDDGDSAQLGYGQRLSAGAVRRLEKLLLRFAPVLKLDSREEFFPMSFTGYLRHCALKFRPPARAVEQGASRDPIVAVPHGELTIDRLLKQQHHGLHSDRRKNPRNGRTPYGLWPHASILHGDPDLVLPGHTHSVGGKKASDKSKRLKDIPLYADVRYHKESHSIEIRYMFFFPYNGWYNVLGTKQGHHTADLEHCTVRVDADTLELSRCFYGAHGYVDGVWRDVPQLEQEEGSDRPVMYVTKSFHGVMPERGDFRRFVVCKEMVNGQGHEWRPETIIPVVPWGPWPARHNTQWMQYSGCLGSDGVSSANDQRWWYEEYPGPPADGENK